MSEYAEYIGRQSRQRDFITPAMIERYRAVIGDEGRGRALPYGCLLYTSPSPRDKRQSRMPSSA